MFGVKRAHSRTVFGVALRILINCCVRQKASNFEPDKVEDHYETALLELINQKRAGKVIRPKERPKGENVVDLMHALRQSAGRAAVPAKRESPKKPRKAAAGQNEMLLPIAGRKSAEEAAKKQQVGHSASRLDDALVWSMALEGLRGKIERCDYGAHVIGELAIVLACSLVQLAIASFGSAGDQLALGSEAFKTLQLGLETGHCSAPLCTQGMATIFVQSGQHKHFQCCACEATFRYGGGNPKPPIAAARGVDL